MRESGRRRPNREGDGSPHGPIENKGDRPSAQQPEWRRGHPLTARGLARMLEPLGIHPARCDTPTGRLRGYRRDAFRDAIARYLPSHPSMCPQTSVSGSLEQLRERMPRLREREQALRTELKAIAEQTRDRAAYLRLADTLSAFLARLHEAADTLDILERQRIVRLVVKEVLVDDATIVIRHAIPVSSGPPHRGSSPLSRSNDVGNDRSYLLRTGSNVPISRA